MRRLFIIAAGSLLTCSLIVSTMCAAGFQLPGNSIQAKTFLTRAEKEKDPKKSIVYALKSLTAGKESGDDAHVAKAYRHLGWLYRNERTPELYQVDSLFVNYAARSGNEDLLFEALTLAAKDLVNSSSLSKAAKYISGMDSLAAPSNSDFRKCQTAQVMALLQTKKIKLKDALWYASESLRYASKLPDKTLLCRSLHLLGDIQMYRMKYDSSGQYLYQAMEVSRQMNDDFEIAQVYKSLGDLFTRSASFPAAMEYYDKAELAYTRNGNIIEAAYIPLARSEIYLTQKKGDSVLLSINRSLHTFRKIGLQQGIIFCNTYLGRYYALTGKPDSASYYFSLSTRGAKTAGVPLISFYADAYQAINQLESGKPDSSYRLLKDLSDSHHIVFADEMISGAVDKLYLPGYSKKAKDTMKALLLNPDAMPQPIETQINPFTGAGHELDSLLVIKQQQIVAELESKYKVKEARDSTQIAIAETRLAKKGLALRNVIIASCVLLLLLFARLLQVQRKNRVRAQQEAERAVADAGTIRELKDELDHRTGGILSTIAAIIRRVKGVSSDTASFALLEEKVNPLILLHDLLRKNKTETLVLQEYFIQICDKLKASYDHDDKTSVTIDAPVHISGEKARNVGLIVTELVTNSFRHAFSNETSGRIWVTCNQDQAGHYHLRVADSGPGIKEGIVKDPKKGLGLIYALAYQLKATVSETHESGTVFDFYFS